MPRRPSATADKKTPVEGFLKDARTQIRVYGLKDLGVKVQGLRVYILAIMENQMDKKMENYTETEIIMGCIGAKLRLYGDGGKENGNYSNGVIWGLGFGGTHPNYL